MPNSCINDYNINYWTVLLLQQCYSNNVFLSESVSAFFGGQTQGTWANSKKAVLHRQVMMNGVIVNTCLVKPLANQSLILPSLHQCQLLLVLNRTKIGNYFPGRQTVKEMPCHLIGINLWPWWEGTLLLSSSGDFYICSQSKSSEHGPCAPFTLTAAEFVSTGKSEKLSSHHEAELVVAEGCT